ncbi:hypothetical protein B0H11DRAFT_2050914 [Mycena galericulata]|nr:hypothetical protein B0H11DRAFT_2050914 [Mycena galericulata]
MRDNSITQLLSSLLLGSLSLIPNDTLRYIMLLILACFAIIHALYLQHPSTQLRQLEAKIKKAEELVQEAKLYCVRDFLRLAQQGMRLLEVKRAMSTVKCCMLDTNTSTWKNYRLVSRDIAHCAKNVQMIRTAVQFMLEGERQRRYTEDINEAETMLARSGIVAYHASFPPTVP